MKCCEKTQNKERGMILVVVLWFITCIALLVASLNQTVQSATTVIRDEITASQTTSVLDAGLQIAAFHMVQTGEKQWIADGRTYREVINGIPIGIRIFDESGKVDLNRAKPELLTRFLQRFVTTPRTAIDLTNAIVRVREAAGVRDPQQDEKPKIASLDAGEKTKTNEKRAFAHITQLLDVPGFTYKLYSVLEPHITVYNRRGKINVNTAAREVMLSMPDMTPIEVDRMIAERGLPQAEEAAANDLADGGENVKSKKAGPAYSVIVTQITEKDRVGLEARATVLIDPKFTEPFYVLAWQLADR